MHEKLNDSARAALAAQLHMSASQELHLQHHLQHYQHSKQLPMLSSHAGGQWLPGSPPRPHPPSHPSPPYHPSEERDASSGGQRLDGDAGGTAANPLARRQQREIFDLGVRAVAVGCTLEAVGCCRRCAPYRCS